MSAEADLRTALVAHAPLVALVGPRVVQNGIEVGADLPYIVFTAQHAPSLNLFGTALCNEVTFTVECWDRTAVGADAVADAAIAALVAFAPAVNAAALTSRGSGFDGDLGLDATVLSVSWWE